MTDKELELMWRAAANEAYATLTEGLDDRYAAALESHPRLREILPEIAALVRSQAETSFLHGARFEHLRQSREDGGS